MVSEILKVLKTIFTLADDLQNTTLKSRKSGGSFMSLA